jgi:hypothetical protein
VRRSWSVPICEEWTRSLLRDRPGMDAQIAAAARAMEEAIPDCLVSGYEHLIESASEHRVPSSELGE